MHALHHKLKRLLRGKKSGGFVLAELIVAIALLALVSGIILQLFLVASTSNRSARDLDNASSQAVSVMERLRALRPDEYHRDSILSLGAIEVQSGSTLLTLYYDAEWNPIESPLPNEGFVLNATVTQGREQQQLGQSFSGSDQLSQGQMLRAGMINFKIEVVANRFDNETQEAYSETLLTFESGKYVTKEDA